LIFVDGGTKRPRRAPEELLAALRSFYPA